MNAPALSLVIRTHQVAPSLARLLGALDLQPDDEVVLVDSGSRDATAEVARRYQARWIDRAGHRYVAGEALNAGFAAATRANVLTLSAHVEPLERGLLAGYREIIRRDPELACAPGPIVWFKHQWQPNQPARWLTEDQLAAGATRGRGNPNCLYARRAWEEQPFAGVDAGEDQDWFARGLRRGWRILLPEQTPVLYRPMTRSCRGMWHKGQVDRRIVRQHFAGPREPATAVARLTVRLVQARWRGEMTSAVAARLLAYGAGTWWASR